MSKQSWRGFLLEQAALHYASSGFPLCVCVCRPAFRVAPGGSGARRMTDDVKVCR